jgi:hypothetical protein
MSPVTDVLPDLPLNELHMNPLLPTAKRVAVTVDAAKVAGSEPAEVAMTEGKKEKKKKDKKRKADESINAVRMLAIYFSLNDD